MEKENKFPTREIVTTRIFDAPKEMVFKAWEDPNILMTWWGPDGFTNTFHEFDFKPGGTWSFTMHGPDGTDYANTNVFREIIHSHLIVFDHIEPVHAFTVTAHFVKTGNKTQLSFCMQFESAEEYDRVKPYVIDANEQNFNRLESALLKMQINNTVIL
jgi:uncharacterized protein YndB with AHSA1/START domain